jgi:hypothetical protein
MRMEEIDLNELSLDEIKTLISIKERQQNKKQNVVTKNVEVIKPNKLTNKHYNYNANWDERINKAILVLKENKKRMRITQIMKAVGLTTSGQNINSFRGKLLLRPEIDYVVQDASTYFGIKNFSEGLTKIKIKRFIEKSLFKRQRKHSDYNKFMSERIKYLIKTFHYNYEKALIFARNEWNKQKNDSLAIFNYLDNDVFNLIKNELFLNNKINRDDWNQLMINHNLKLPNYDSVVSSIFYDIENFEQRMGVNKGSIKLSNNTIVYTKQFFGGKDNEV